MQAIMSVNSVGKYRIGMGEGVRCKECKRVIYVGQKVCVEITPAGTVEITCKPCITKVDTSLTIHGGK